MTVLTHSAHAVDTALPDGSTGTIRLLATTDLHGQLLAHDYISDRAQPGTGLAGIASLIDRARAEAAAEGIATVLLDNGDTFQGTPLSAEIAHQPVAPDNPIVACLNALKYDAVGIGNHDLDHGLDYLEAVARSLNMPMICSNLAGLPDTAALQTSALIPCVLTTADAQSAQVQLGIVSLLPPLTGVWNRHVLGPDLQVQDTLECLRRLIPRLRANGADLIVVLAHMGVGRRDCRPGDDPGALALSSVEGIDALITGHSHRRLPGLDYRGRAGVDARGGKVGRLPAVMAGHAGSDLAVLDLQVTLKRGVWKAQHHSSRLLPNRPDTPQSPLVVALCAASHATTRQHLACPVASIDSPLHNYFALVAPSATGRLVAQAKARLVAEALAETEFDALPLLASVAAHTTGGRSGPDHYLHIPKGTVQRRHIAGLDPFGNQIWARLITGQTLLCWLEHSARIFKALQPGRGADQGLIDKRVPGFHFDTIYGVDYRIDLSVPPGKGRIRDLRWQGQPVAPDQQLVIATNQFRAAGGGGFGPADPSEILLRLTAPLGPALVHELTQPRPALWSDTPPWRFGKRSGLQASFLTAPAALDHLKDIAHLSPQVAGRTPKGFARVHLTL